MKSGNLNFLEPSGPLQACNGTALPFTYVLRGKNKFLDGIKVHKMYGIPSLRVLSHSMMTVMLFLHTRFEVFTTVNLNIFISRNGEVY
jgi:hypothetical protein